MTEEELLSVLAADDELLDCLKTQAMIAGHPLPDGARAIPTAIWVRLRSDLEPYLRQVEFRGFVLDRFSHATLREHAASEFSGPLTHSRLAKLFLNRCNSKEPHALGETTHQLIQSGDIDGAVAFLCSLDTIIMHVESGQTLELLSDFQELVDVERELNGCDRDAASGSRFYADAVVEASRVEREQNVATPSLPLSVKTDLPLPSYLSVERRSTRLRAWFAFLAKNSRRFRDADVPAREVVQAALELGDVEDIREQALRIFDLRVTTLPVLACSERGRSFRRSPNTYDEKASSERFYHESWQ